MHFFAQVLGWTAMHLIVTFQTNHLSTVGAELQFVYGKYNGMTIEEARNWKVGIARSHRQASSKFACMNEAECPWYIVQDKGTLVGKMPRSADIGMLMTCDGDATNGFDCLPCTAFYVGVDLLATAGHCVIKVGVTEPTKRLLIFFHQFDGKDDIEKDEEMVKVATRARIVTEWWIPEGFYNHLAEACGSTKTGSDIAFLRVDKPKATKEPPYALTQPGELVSQRSPVFMLGYPDDQALYRRAVKVEATLYDPKDTQLQSLLEPKIEDKLLKQYKDAKLLIMVASNKGSMYNGGSGGPVFQAAKVLNYDTMRNVIGISAFTRKVHEVVVGAVDKVAKRDPAKQKTETTLMATISKEMIDAMMLLRDRKPVPTVAGKAIPAGEAKAC